MTADSPPDRIHRGDIFWLVDQILAGLLFQQRSFFR